MAMTEVQCVVRRGGYWLTSNEGEGQWSADKADALRMSYEDATRWVSIMRTRLAGLLEVVPLVPLTPAGALIVANPLN